MNDILEKKLKEFLPYIIIIGAVYLIMPAFLVSGRTSVVFNQIVYIGIFPLAALSCGFHYGYKKTNDFYLSLVAPIIYIPSMLLYGNLRANPLNCIIFLISYFICGYIGLTLGEMFSSKNSDENKDKSEQKKEVHTRKRVPKRVKTTEQTHRFKSDVFEDDIKMPEEFETEHSDVIDGLFDDTQDDIDSILNDIRNRNDY